MPYIKTTINYLHSQNVPKVFVLGLKNQHPDGIKFLFKHVFTRNNHKIRTLPHKNVAIINHHIKKVQAEFEYFDLLDLFCNDSGCKRITEDGYLVIFDGTHLTPYGAQLLGERVHQTEWFQSLLHK